MYILADDPFYELIRNYDLEGMEYFLMADEKPYRGLDSHRDAVIFAMQKVNEDEAEDIKQAEEEFGSEYDDKMHLYSCDIGKATARLMEARTLLYVPKMLKKEFLNREYEGINHNGLETNEFLPYWYAFLEAPHEYGRYDPEDFIKVNKTLFPYGEDDLEVYEWSTDWSDYFEAGHEWWGAACRSVFDMKLNRYVVMLSSATD